MNPTAAAVMSGDDDDGEPLQVHLRWRVGDTYTSEEWAVLINDGPVDLSTGGWSVVAQARADADDEAKLAEWSTAAGTILLGTTDLQLEEGADPVATSTVQLAHTPTLSRGWGPFVALFECGVERRALDAGPDVEPLEAYTITAGTAIADPDVSR